MNTVTTICNEFTEKFTEHIVSVDHNVPDDFDQEFSFHAICHPRVDSKGSPCIPDDIENYLDEISDKYDVSMDHMHVHFNVKVKDEILGISEENKDELKKMQTK